MKFFYAFSLAFNMLSIIPFFKVHNFYKGINGSSAMFYPLVGLILGLILWASHTLLLGLIPQVHLSVIIFTLWVLLTGALHIDGLSDSIDGLFVSKDKALQVMKDSHVGGMGMTFTFVFLALKLSSLLAFEAFYLLPIILMYSRFSALLAIYFYPYISSGVGKLIKNELNKKHLLFALLYTLVFGMVFNFLPALVFVILTLVICAKVFTSRLNGLNGDNYGFIIELTELVLLNSIIFINFS
ncbi:MAG: adenosylcobinamide-GDP ribazoletransferase [Flavobacteriales bacterium]|nr:adenosylcobinamide-GDP ribazoletransferase [Flavobacteriales bacterium]